MSRRVLAVAVVLLAVGGAGVLFVGDLSPGETLDPGTGHATTVGGSDSEDGQTDDDSGGSAATTTESSTGDGSTGYAFTIEKIEKCGDTCRDVTARLANTGQETRQNVRVTTKVYADGDLLWTGNESVGTLQPDESHTSTKRVKLSYWEAMKIKNNDGYVTIVTVVRSDSGTTRFEERRKVA